MPDEQIIKALEYCNTDVRESTCPKCAFYKKHRCSTLMLNAISDLINRQKERIKESEEKLAENEELLNDRIQESVNAVSEADQKYICALERSIAAKDVERERLLQKLQQAKSEAIKDFAKRLKSRVNDLEFRTKTHRKTVSTKFCDDNANWVMHECIPEEIDKLVKEMTEE